ncbi:hypothetical protein [Tabrizicola sp. M-4]|uniref:hypothetical protein n=1 Tax=Tabrizicola sp. M-4 TaxID=3055847 RepID=UPI003DA8E06C
MSMSTTIRLNGLHGRVHDFNLYPLHGTVFPRVSGVYVAMRSAAFGEIWPLYVGESDDLYRRLISDRMAHEGLTRAIMRGATHIAAKVMWDRSARISLETELRHSLNPPCNKQGLGLFG